MMSDKPTCEELFNEDGFREMFREADDSWRHGAYVTQVFLRIADATYWRTTYELSTDGECHGLREGTADIAQVKPVEETVVAYVPITQPTE